MTDASRVAVALPRINPGTQRAVVAGAAAVLCLLLACILFPDEALGAFRVWAVSPTFNHCFLVLPISLFMIWQRRGVLEDASIQPDWHAAILVLCLSVAWLAASILGVLEVRQFDVVSVVQATLFGVLGTAFYRKLAAPFLYLYFLVPSGAYLIPFLQAFTARFTVVGLHVLGIPVFSNGAVIEIPAGTFAVAEACAGLRFLVAAVAFGVFFAVITYRSWWRRTAFVALSIVVPIIANGFRALGLVAVAQWIGSPEAALADHILYGWIFFSLVLVLLIWVGYRFSDRHEYDGRAAPTPARTEGKSILSRGALVAIACFSAAAVGPISVSVLAKPDLVDMPQLPPTVAPSWRRIAASANWRPVIIGSTRSFTETFIQGGFKIDRYVALYGGHGSNLVRSDNRDADERMWSFDTARSAILPVGSHSIPVRVSTWLRGAEKRLVWSFYVVNGRVVTGTWTTKREQLRAYFAGGHCVSAYIALSTEAPDDPAAARAVGRLLAATEPVKPYLCRVTTAPKPR